LANKPLSLYSQSRYSRYNRVSVASPEATINPKTAKIFTAASLEPKIKNIKPLKNVFEIIANISAKVEASVTGSLETETVIASTSTSPETRLTK
jgi:hypothetical protein